MSDSLTEPQTDIDSISNLIHQYFDGLHQGDCQKLRQIFHPDCVLKAPGVRRSLEQWFSLVNERAVPQQRGDSYHYRIIAIDVIGDQAMAKIFCPLLDRKYIDFLGFLREDQQWKIVNKMYADL